MDKIKRIEKKFIEKTISENFIKIIPPFYELQSTFLSGIYKRYDDLEGGHIVIYFARDVHLEILRKREVDLDFNLSLDEFWNNHKNVNYGKKKIILISKKTGLPKETARRKILDLIKKKHLQKGEKNKIYWEPASEFKNTYIKIIEEQINSLSKFIYHETKYLQLNVPFSKIEKEIKSNYSFYWYHFLNFQLEWLKNVQEQFKDLEIVLISLQVIIQTMRYVANNIGGNLDVIMTNKIPKNLDLRQANISATSIAEITGIPRATCIRKLEKLSNLQVVEKDPTSKRYFFLTNKLQNNPYLKHGDTMKQTLSLICNFSSIIIKALVK